jgi:L-2,4-diaminobutyrate decarboxylase
VGESTSLAGRQHGHDRLAELIPLSAQRDGRGRGRARRRRSRGRPGGRRGDHGGGGTAGLRPVGVGEEGALTELTTLLTAGSVDPAQPWCAAHLHCPPLAVSVAADVAAAALNLSMDSWDQAPVASELERVFTTSMARLCYPGEPQPDAVVTTGGTESNLLGLLLARERNPKLQPVCGHNAHHSVARAAWLLGLPAPLLVDCAGERVVPAALDAVLRGLTETAVVVATAGTTNTGDIDPLREIAQVCRRHGARLHVDAAYGGPALFSTALRPLLDGLDGADSIALDCTNSAGSRSPACPICSAARSGPRAGRTRSGWRSPCGHWAPRGWGSWSNGAAAPPPR